MAGISDQTRSHYLEFGIFTFPGPFQVMLRDNLPHDVREIGRLVRQSFIHRTTLEAGNTGTNEDLRFGDMNQVPWWRQSEDDVLQTAGAMLIELMHRDDRGFVPDRAPESKLVLTCRYVAILMASILKSQNIPVRARSGHAPYFDMGDLGKISTDHWINQYWSDEQERWVTIDIDGSLSLEAEPFDPYDMPEGAFDYPADSWLAVRSGQIDENHFYNAGGVWGLNTVLWALGYDFHSLMNHEIIYNHGFAYGEPKKFKRLAESELEKIDNLAKLMQNPDENFEDLKRIWETDKDFRLLVGSLL